MKKLHAVIMATLALLAAPVASFAQGPNGVWTSVGSSGATIDESDLRIYAVDGPDLFFAPNKGGTINARYNVVNTSNAFGTQTPAWTILELGYTDASTFGSVTAYLWKVTPCTGEKVLLCSVTSLDNGTGCNFCQFANNSFNFLTNLYYVGVEVSRSSPNANPILHTLRIY
jgi:hypothetical protein